MFGCLIVSSSLASSNSAIVRSIFALFFVMFIIVLSKFLFVLFIKLFIVCNCFGLSSVLMMDFINVSFFVASSSFEFVFAFVCFVIIFVFVFVLIVVLCVIVVVMCVIVVVILGVFISVYVCVNDVGGVAFSFSFIM